MNDYEERQEEKRQRLQSRAANHRAKSVERYESSTSAVAGIPLGQPILVGHHSEGRHRRALDKSWSDMGRSVEHDKQADELERRADAVGTGGISSDDPTAIEQLRAKLSTLEERQASMKRVNQQFRRGGWSAVEGLTDEQRAQAEAALGADWRSNPKPFESFQLTNNNANIRRIKKRIASLENNAAIEDGREEFEGYALVLNTEENRVQIVFDGKPNKTTCKFMRSNGFVFSRRNTAWQRQLNQGGINTANWTAKALADMELYG